MDKGSNAKSFSLSFMLFEQKHTYCSFNDRVVASNSRTDWLNLIRGFTLGTSILYENMYYSCSPRLKHCQTKNSQQMVIFVRPHSSAVISQGVKMVQQPLTAEYKLINL